MKLFPLPILGLASAAASHPTLQPRAGGYGQGNNSGIVCNTQCAQDSLAFAFAYGFPLYPFSNVLQDDERIATNILISQKELRTADDREIVRPNADTLYSTIFYDLSLVDLEITVPDFGDRYGVWPFYDLYGGNFANIGSLADVTHGKFLLSYDQTNMGLSIENVPEGYDGYIGMYTPYGQSVVRIVTDNSTDDLEIVHQLQDQMTVKPIPRKIPSGTPRLDLEMFKDPYYKVGNGTALPEVVLRLTAALAPLNEPEVVGDRSWIAETLKNAGCEDGKFTQPMGTNLTGAFAAANQSVTALLSQPGYTEYLSNNWTNFDRRIVGDYHSYYQARYLIARYGYLMLTYDQASYPTNTDVVEVGPTQAILVEFSGRPVLKDKGFWSLTAYGADQFFVPNDLNRYALGDRSNLTFPDGTLVYSNNEEKKPDGPFSILIQPADITPPDNWTSNWLPALAGGGDLSWNLRWYGADDAMNEGGSYVYPKVSLIDAITA